MLRLFRVIVLVMFIVVSLIFGVSFITNYMKTDNTIPVITIDKDIIDVPLDADDKDLLAGVKAYDDKDGDLTGRVIVENISKFREKGVCEVTYAVCDSDNHVVAAKRKIRYPDYVSPQFYMKGTLCFSLYQKVDISNIIGAIDCIDGDISDKITLTSVDYTSGTEGNFTLEAKVTNSRGDTIKAEFPLIVEARSTSSPSVILKDYLIYAKKGQKFNFANNVEAVRDASGNSLALNVYIESNYNPNAEGLYTIHYLADDGSGRDAHSILVVIVGN